MYVFEFLYSVGGGILKQTLMLDYEFSSDKEALLFAIDEAFDSIDSELNDEKSFASEEPRKNATFLSLKLVERRTK